MDGVGGLEGCRWIFILEGILTVVIAFISFFLLPDYPETAKFLTHEERAWVVHRLKYQGSNNSDVMVVESKEFQWKYIRDAFNDWQVYLQASAIILTALHNTTQTNFRTALIGEQCALYGYVFRPFYAALISKGSLFSFHRLSRNLATLLPPLSSWPSRYMWLPALFQSPLRGTRIEKHSVSRSYSPRYALC